MDSPMVYLGRSPSPPLDQFIERIWYCSDPAPHARERVLPGGGAVDLILNLADDEIEIYDAVDPAGVRAHSGALIAGSRTCSFLVDPRQRKSVMGAHFRPGGAFPFLGISPSEIVDSHVPLHDVWGGEGRELRERLAEAPSSRERFRLLETALLRRMRRARPGHPAARVAVEAFRASGRELLVGDVAASVGLSRRRFIQVFEREVGLTPKLYVRLERFHRVKQHVAALGEPSSWAALALACGYCDQSHMIRDFVEFAGISPTSYLGGRGEETAFDHFVHAFRQD